jgi:hypothetical protein
MALSSPRVSTSAKNGAMIGLPKVVRLDGVNSERGSVKVMLPLLLI